MAGTIVDLDADRDEASTDAERKLATPLALEN